jgi:hypothetical protein
MYQVLEFQA